MGNDALLGLSTHNEQQFRSALEQPADYVALGPVFGTQSKVNPDPIVGLHTLKALRPLTMLPIVAIGGIGMETAPRALEAGADSVAVISALLPDRRGDLRGLEVRAAEWLRNVE